MGVNLKKISKNYKRSLSLGLAQHPGVIAEDHTRQEKLPQESEAERHSHRES